MPFASQLTVKEKKITRNVGALQKVHCGGPCNECFSLNIAKRHPSERFVQHALC